jgi:hypothetical protein
MSTRDFPSRHEALSEALVVHESASIDRGLELLNRLARR